MSTNQSLLGIFPYLDDVLTAIGAVRKTQLRIQTVYSPTSRHEITEALGLSPLSRVRYFTITGAILGILAGIVLSVTTSLEWEFVVSGKPVIPVVTTVIVSFELCILMAILFNLVGMLTQSRMPALKLPPDYDPRFSVDQFGVVVVCDEGNRAEAARILRESGAEEVHEIHG
jgi:rhodanese-related sulfurtransferase